MATAPASEDRILSVGEVTRAIKESLTEGFSAIWVKGEVSSLKKAGSGHLYFSLKEGSDALLKAVIWRSGAARLTFDLRDGTEVEAFGDLDVYAPRGEYQLIVRQMRPAGLGALLLQLEELKRRLAAEGLFDPARKRPLPQFPRTIGVVTSPVGAAIRDIVKVLRARWPGIRIVLAPVRVQGQGSAAEIAAAIERFNRWGQADLLIVGRGGGSLEDLWAFNEEPVVRAIAGSRTPVISAVGHEVDTTLADLAADVRAATPSNAAEIAVRDAKDLQHRVGVLLERSRRATRKSVLEQRRHLESLLAKYGFRRVRDLFATFQQTVDLQRERIDDAIRAHLARLRSGIDTLARAYGLREFPRRVSEHRAGVTTASKRLTNAVVAQVLSERRREAALADRLRALSPRAVLDRGYSLVRTAEGRLVRGPDTLRAGTRVTIEFARGEAAAVIESIAKGGKHAAEEER